MLVVLARDGLDKVNLLKHFQLPVKKALLQLLRPLTYEPRRKIIQVRVVVANLLLLQLLLLLLLLLLSASFHQLRLLCFALNVDGGLELTLLRISSSKGGPAARVNILHPEGDV